MARRFTVAEANALLPTIRPWLEDLRGLAERLVAVREQLAAIDPPSRLDGQAGRALELETAAAALAAQADGLLRRLHELGVEVKDPLSGLIDFRSLRQGREVYLCWRLGEGEIAWWHELDAGFPGRKPLS